MKSRENYLRAIYRLTEKGEKATSTGEISGELDVSNASVSEAVKKLEEENLICRKPYKGITLSPMGKEEAYRATEKYRKLKKLFQETGVEEPEKEADNVEHSISMKAVEKMMENM